MDARCKAPDSISIHAAREGGDPAQAAQSRPQGEFQSTPPVKAATKSKIASLQLRTFQSTPPVKAATEEAKAAVMEVYISIHAAREGGDTVVHVSAADVGNFNPRRP